MRTPVIWFGVFVILTVAAFAQEIPQFVPCKFEPSKLVGTTDGVEVRRVTIDEGSEQVGATVFHPVTDSATSGILFSHSALESLGEKADLSRFAFGLARAGATAIVLDGTIAFTDPNRDNDRSPHLLACAGQWLLTNFSMDRSRLLEAGPIRQWGHGMTPTCMPGEDPCWDSMGILNFGFTTGKNTPTMLSSAGRLRAADYVKRHLKLGELKPEWFEESAAQ